MGNAPNAIVPLIEHGPNYWAEVHTIEVRRPVVCHRCRKRYDVLWLQVQSVQVVKSVRNQHVPVTDPVMRREAETEARQVLDRPANAEHGVIMSEGFRCNKCCGTEED